MGDGLRTIRVVTTDESLMASFAEWGDAVQFVAIAPNANETLDEIKQVSEERGIPLVLHDPEREIAELYGAEMTPHIYILDKDGLLVYQGAFDDVTFRQRTPSQFFATDAVNAILNGDRPLPGETQAYGCTIVYYAE